MLGIESTGMYLCPNCHGQKTVSKPPHIAGDQETWTAGDSKLYPCPTCNGMGYIISAGNPMTAMFRNR
jgi:Zn finger protein HypA/HybF involved in hydrogenase expression